MRFIPPSGPVPEPLNRREVYLTERKPDRRLPMPGTCLTRVFKGRVHEVLVQPKGFECEGQFCKSLSAVAHAITGSHWNGYYFFKKSLVDTPRRRAR